MKQNVAIQHQKSEKSVKFYQLSRLVPILIGSIFLALIAQISIPLPFTPVPLSLQTFGLSLLTIFPSPRNAPVAVLAYLAQASIGLPVLAGGMPNPVWILGAKAGYLLGFVVATYVVARLLEKVKTFSFVKVWLIFSLNELIVLTMGTLWLAFFVPAGSAFYMGFLPFIVGGIIKISLSTTVYRLAKKR